MKEESQEREKNLKEPFWITGINPIIGYRYTGVRIESNWWWVSKPLKKTQEDESH